MPRWWDHMTITIPPKLSIGNIFGKVSGEVILSKLQLVSGAECSTGLYHLVRRFFHTPRREVTHLEVAKDLRFGSLPEGR